VSVYHVYFNVVMSVQHMFYAFKSSSDDVIQLIELLSITLALGNPFELSD